MVFINATDLRHYRTTTLVARKVCAKFLWVRFWSAERDGSVLIEVKNKFALGDSLVLLTPTGNHPFVLSSLQDQDGNPMDEAPGAGYTVCLKLPAEAGEMGIIVRIIAK